MSGLFLLFVFCLPAVFGCKYSKNPGLLSSSFDTLTPGELVDSDRIVDTDPLYAGPGGIIDYPFALPIFMLTAAPNFWIRVCDNGILHLADAQPNLQPCITQAALVAPGIDPSNPQPIIIADSINEAVMVGVTYLVDIHHVLRSDQVGADGNATGPSFCDIETVEGIINDCQETHRGNQTVEEYLVVTWNTPGTMYGGSAEYLFQAIVAVTSELKTYVIFLYKDYQNLVGVNGVLKGQMHAANALLASWDVRYAEICNGASDTEIHLKSNCRCAQPGHYVFETTENISGINGICGTEVTSATCATQPSVDFGTNVNKNCRTPEYPQDTCDDSVHCLSGTNDELFIKFKNYNADRVTFVNYTHFTQTDGSTGFEAPYGDNVNILGVLGSCTFTVTPSNDTFENVTLNVPSTDNCFEYDQVTNIINFVLIFWKNADGVNVHSGYTRFLVGSCDLDHLPSAINATVNVSDIASTSLAPKSGYSLGLGFYDRKSITNFQQFTSATVVQIGRMIFPQVCYVIGSPYLADVDPYGVYVYSCKLANNPEFLNSAGNITMNLIQDDGCLTSQPGPGEAGRLVHHFKRDSLTLNTLFCIASGGFKAFYWGNEIGSTSIYMQCEVSYCHNTQLYPYSKCRDSCANTIIDANVTDADDARRKKRQIDGDIVTAVIQVVDYDPDQVTETTTETMKSNSSSQCVDPVMAKGVIGALVALLILATSVTIILFFLLKSTKVD